jgi:hypothetical protein
MQNCKYYRIKNIRCAGYKTIGFEAYSNISLLYKRQFLTISTQNFIVGCLFGLYFDAEDGGKNIGKPVPDYTA